MPFERDILRRALGRLGRVPQEKLNLSRQRVRGNLKVDIQPKTPLPLPDATPADLTVLRRPYYISGAMALICLFIVGGAVVRSRFENLSASTAAVKSASRQTVESQAPAQPPRSGLAPRFPVIATLPNPNEKQPYNAQSGRQSAAATQIPAAGPPPVPAPRPRALFTLLPPGEGKVILDRACGACHRAAAVGAYHYATRAQYGDVVSRMIAMGAQVSEEEAPVLTDYLFDNLRDKPAREVDTSAREILERACTGCHNLNGIENYSYDSEEPYRELISTMVSYGAMLSEGEKTTLIQYLFTTYGKR